MVASFSKIPKRSWLIEATDILLAPLRNIRKRTTETGVAREVPASIFRAGLFSQTPGAIWIKLGHCGCGFSGGLPQILLQQHAILVDDEGHYSGGKSSFLRPGRIAAVYPVVEEFRRIDPTTSGSSVTGAAHSPLSFSGAECQPRRRMALKTTSPATARSRSA